LTPTAEQEILGLNDAVVEVDVVAFPASFIARKIDVLEQDAIAFPDRLVRINLHIGHK
jgi:hypothetical protein